MTEHGAMPDEARICELLLDGSPAAADELERLSADPRAARAIARLSGFLERCRTLGSEDELDRFGAPGLPGGGTPPFVSRILDRTTREDLSWRGDLRLVGRFVAEALSSSVLLRVTAASLVLHLAAAPVVAWVVLRGRAPEPHFYTRIEPGADDPFREDLPEPRDDAPLGQEALDAHVAGPIGIAPEALWRAATQNALRVDRWCLATGVLPEPVGDVPDERVLALLWYRSHEARGGTALPDAGADAPLPELERALVLELLLDRVARDGDQGAADLVRRATVGPGSAGPDGRLLEAARARARAYGLRAAPADAEGEVTEDFDPAEHALCGRDAARWRADLRLALAERGLAAHPAAAPWLLSD